MAPHSNTLAWKIPWMEKPGRLQSAGSWRVGQDWATSFSLFTLMHWRRKWQPTPVFLPRECEGGRSLIGCRRWERVLDFIIFFICYYLLLLKIILVFFFPLIWCIRLCDCCILNQPFILRLINLIWWWHNFLIPFWIWLNNIFVCIFHVYINDRYWPVVYFLVDSDFNIKVTLASLRCEAIFPLLLCGRFWEQLLLFLLSIISRRIAEAIHSWVFLFMSSFVGNIFFVFENSL